MILSQKMLQKKKKKKKELVPVDYLLIDLHEAPLPL